MNPSNCRPMLVFSSMLEANQFMKPFLQGHDLVWSFAHHYGYSLMDQPFKLTCVVTGMSPEKSAKALNDALDRFSTTNTIFGLGVCSGLVKTAAVGDICIAKRVRLENDQVFILGDTLVRDLEKIAMDKQQKILQTLYTCQQHLDSITDKAAVHVASHCDVYDTTSGSWIKVALERNIACVILKTIVDDALNIIAPEFLSSMDKFGRPQMGALLSKMFFKPTLYQSLKPYRAQAMTQLLQPQAQILFDLFQEMQQYNQTSHQETIEREDPQLSLLNPA